MIRRASPCQNPSILLHFASVVCNTGPFMEFPVRAVTHDSWYDPAFVIQPGGRVKVPTGPGLGISYDEGIWKQAEKL